MLWVVGRNFNEVFEQARMLVQGPGLAASRALLQINYNEPASAWLSLFVYLFIYFIIHRARSIQRWVGYKKKKYTAINK